MSLRLRYDADLVLNDRAKIRLQMSSLQKIAMLIFVPGYFRKIAHLQNPSENIAPASPGIVRVKLGFNMLVAPQCVLRSPQPLRLYTRRADGTLHEYQQILL